MKKFNKKKRFSLRKKILITTLIIILSIILSISSYLFYLSSKVNRVEIDRSYVTKTGQTPNKADKNVITVALLGSDYSDGQGASDSTMILSIDTEKKNIKLMSLMRDIYLDLPDGGKSNLNYTMNSGGPELLLRTINYNFNLTVDKFIHVDLKTLPKIIDKLGGVEIEITDAELKYINSYIHNIDSENGTNTLEITKSGKQLLNGTQASAYCRIRYTEGSDYKRTERQRDVLQALFNKFKDISILDVQSLTNDLLPYVSTNMTNTEMLDVATKALSLGVNNIEQGRFPLDQDHTSEWTDMYHMIIDKEATKNAIHKFIYSE